MLSSTTLMAEGSLSVATYIRLGVHFFKTRPTAIFFYTAKKNLDYYHSPLKPVLFSLPRYAKCALIRINAAFVEFTFTAH